RRLVELPEWNLQRIRVEAAQLTPKILEIANIAGLCVTALNLVRKSHGLAKRQRNRKPARPTGIDHATRELPNRVDRLDVPAFLFVQQLDERAFVDGVDLLCLFERAVDLVLTKHRDQWPEPATIAVDPEQAMPHPLVELG